MRKREEEARAARKAEKQRIRDQFEKDKKLRRERAKKEAASEWDSDGYVDDISPP